MEKKKRGLDGYYFRVKRNEKWDNVCFSDLTEEERKSVLEGRSTEWLQALCLGLGEIISLIGEELNIVAFGVEDEDNDK